MSGLNERSKRQIALLASDDLDELQVEEARRSIDSCPHCRTHWTRVRGCLDVLERAGKECPLVPGFSLWPMVESRLTRSTALRPERFNGWVPALSMAAACIALLIAGQLETSPQEFGDSESTPPVRRIRVNPVFLPDAGFDGRAAPLRPDEAASLGSTFENAGMSAPLLPFDQPAYGLGPSTGRGIE